MQRDPIAARLEAFAKLCRQKGLPLTVQRRVILEAVLRREDHPSADQIYETVHRQLPQLSRTTVYRVLETLSELGAIRRVPHAASVARFDGKVHRHHHLVCKQCNKIVDFENSDLDRLHLPEGRPQGFEIEDFSVQFSGTCVDCRKKRRAKR